MKQVWRVKRKGEDEIQRDAGRLLFAKDEPVLYVSLDEVVETTMAARAR